MDDNPYKAPQERPAANNKADYRVPIGPERRKRSVYSWVILLLFILAVAIMVYEVLLVRAITGK
jgi:hypothetical protein